MRIFLISLFLCGTSNFIFGQTIDTVVLNQLHSAAEKNKIVTLTGFSFFDYSSMSDEQESKLYAILSFLQENEESIEILVHSDCRGSEDYNDDLTQRKADIFGRWLIRKGINANRLSGRGMGANVPIISCKNCRECTEEELRINSRVEIIIKSL